MKKRMGLILASVVLCSIFTISGAMLVTAEKNETAVPTSTVQSYNLYTTDTLVSAMGGKKFTPVAPSESKIKFSGTIYNNLNQEDQTWNDMIVAQEKNGQAQLNIWSDSAYNYNAGNTVSLDGTTNYQIVSYPEVFFEGYTGGFIGEEWLIENTINVEDYSVISVNVSYGAFGNLNPPALIGSDYIGEAFVFAYGKDNDGNEKTVQSAMIFGIDYWSTGIVELNLEEIATVERIAVLVASQSIDLQSDNARYIWISDFTVSAREKAVEKKFFANEQALQFYNGNSIVGRFDGTAMRVYHDNGAYAWSGGWADGSNEYVYATQRMSKGNFVTLLLKEPVKASDYKYLDLELKPIAQVADGSWLAETATEFTYSVLKYDATTTESSVNFTLNNSQWSVCRIPLETFADANGYVSRLVIYYSDNNRSQSENESVYSINTAIHNALLTSEEYDYENCNLISQYSTIEKVGVTLGDDLALRFTASIGDDWTNLDASFTFNGKTIGIASAVNGEAVYTFDDISPKNVGDEVTFTVQLSGSKLQKEQWHSATLTKTYSVKEYCEAILTMDATSLGISENKFAKLQSLAVDMLNYGASAQEYANYNVDSLANANLSEEDKSKATAFDESITGVYSNTKSMDETIYVAGARLWLDTKVNVGFKVVVGSNITGTVKAQVKIGDADWSDVAELNAGETEIKVTGLTAIQLNETITVRILVDEVASGAVCEYSVYRYIANKGNETDVNGDLTSNAELARALQSYGQGAAAYENEQ